MITSVVTVDFDCMQFLSRAKAFSFPFSTVAIFWLLDWLWSFRFIAINRWIILLKSGNQNIKFLFNHLQFLKRRQLLLRSLRLYFSENPTKPISEASCILVVNCKTLTGKLTRFKGFAVSDTLFKG